MKTQFEEIVCNYEAGSPQDSSIRWVGLLPGQLMRKALEIGISLSRYMVKQFLALLGFKKRRYSKQQSLGVSANRNAQFEKIAILKQTFLESGLPVLSIDTKKKELLGNFDRKESYWGKTKRSVNDHDFQSKAEGIVIPHGIYDIADNTGYISLGTSKDTSEFVCDNIAWAWQNHLQWKYQGSKSILLLCDGGGSNSCNHYIVKQDLVKLAKTINMNILVAHYPAYCSKWNPIEHRLFCHVHKAYEGAIFHNIELVEELTKQTATKTGLNVHVRINDKQYLTGRKYTKEFKENIDQYIDFDDQIPKWNYRIKNNIETEVIF